ncbi:MAG: UvrB/UvrC motif-containing protein [Planctomycetota bacterium]
MTLDLQELTADWNCPPGEISARLVVGRDGQELLQLRVDLGLMQMFPDGRPDGRRYRGMPGALDHIRHELRLHGRVPTDDWRELERELFQINYRRLALSSILEESLTQGDVEGAASHVRRALRDIDTCLDCLQTAQESEGDTLGNGSFALKPTLIFHQGRLGVQARIIAGHYEEAIEEAGLAADRIGGLLLELGLDEEQCNQDPGVTFLRNLEARLRQEYGIQETLRERLEEAIENDDFETAARLHDELRNRHESEGAPRRARNGDS